jgi:hypothetical protein
LELPAILGDLVHNLRAVLDHLIWASVETNGNIATEHTGFPIFPDRQSFSSGAHQRLAGTSATAKRVVELLRPYKGGNDLLWILHRLDIVDKHKLLVVVGAAYQSLVLKFRMKIPGQEEPVHFPPLALNPEDRLFPIEDGDELYRVKAQVRAAGMAHDEPQFQIQLFLGSVETSQSEPLLLFAQRAFDQVGRICLIFAKRVLI